MKRAVLIGINYYGTENELNGCVNDIRDMKAYLVRRGFDDIVVLSDEPGADIMPTADNILRELGHIIDISEDGDMAFIHYSGHGTNTPDMNGDERDGIDECICALDSNIIDDTIADVLMRAKAGVKIRAVFDSCNSGTVLDLPYRYNNVSIVREGAVKMCADIICISGCADPQTSADASFMRGDQMRANGALTYTLLSQLNEPYRTSYRKLCKKIRADLVSGGYTQTPQLTYVHKDALARIVDI
jgi:metacaspase-1